MKRGQFILVIVVVLALLLLGGGSSVQQVIDQVVDSVTNGSRVGPATTIDAQGDIDADVGALAQAAGMDPDTYALARMMSSEHGQQPDEYLYACGWAVVNYAAERGLSVATLVTNPTGLFGEQKAASGTKYCSSANDPYDRHAAAAAAVMTGAVSDPTGGATHFFSPKAQDQLAAEAAAGDARYRKYAGNAATTFASWTAPGGLYPQGAVAVVPPGIDGHVLTLFRRAA